MSSVGPKTNNLEQFVKISTDDVSQKETDVQHLTRDICDFFNNTPPPPPPPKKTLFFLKLWTYSTRQILQRCEDILFNVLFNKMAQLKLETD